MSAPNQPPAALGGDWKLWGERLVSYIARNANKLQHKNDRETASEDGILMWDRENAYPVVSSGGVFRQIVLADGYAFLFQDNDITAAAANTGYAIVFDTPAAGLAEGITLGDSPNQSRIYFAEGGLYLLAFTAQVYSTPASQVDFYFWPKVNGVDVPSGATRSSLHTGLFNTQTKPVSKSAVINLEAGDYVEAYWAVSSTSGSLEAFAATAFAPSTPSASLSITRIRA